MMDLSAPEAIRFRSTGFSKTREFSCPQCGGNIQYRDWDDEHEAFCYHCTWCGHDTKMTWDAVAVLRATGSVKFDENKDPIVPDGVTVPPIPSDPNNDEYEDWDAMKTISAQGISPGYMEVEEEEDP